MKLSTVRFPQALSVLILGFQLYIPWSVKHMVTQDGSAHVYTASVTSDLVFHRHTSPYHAVYRVQKTALPNWTGTVLLAGFLGLFGSDRAEAFMTTVCMLTAYAGFYYCASALAGGSSVSLLIGNWLIQPWFLWGGFYNFYLGMALFLLLTGYYLRRDGNLTWGRAAILSCGLAGVFFTHLIPAILAGMTVAVLAFWRHRGWSGCGKPLAAICPTAALIMGYGLQFRRSNTANPDVLNALLEFPQKTFLFAGGWAGEQKFIWPVVLVGIVIAIVTMKRAEWRSARGALAVVACAAFLLYLLVPDAGFGGSVVKMRFAWAFFLLGGLLVRVVDRLRPFQAVLAIYIAIPLTAHLSLAAGQVKQNSEAAELYLSAMDKLPIGASFVRIFYPAPAVGQRFETNRLAFNPLQHLEELGAVRRHAVCLSDYQAATGTFGATFKSSVNPGQSASLWAFESPNAQTGASLDWLRGGLPVPIDYMVIYGDEVPADVASRGKLVAANAGTRFVWIYKL